MSELTEFKCDYCGMVGKKQKGHYNSNVRNGKKNYCSMSCSKKERDTKVDALCGTCGQSFKVTRSVYTRSLAKNFFCGHSCSAKYSNTRRKHTDETKRKIAESQGFIWKNKTKKEKIPKPPKPMKICPFCEKEFKSKYKATQCCSSDCAFALRFGAAPCQKDELVNTILNSYKDSGLTPQKRDFSRRVYGAAIRLFGTWNKAMQECGLKPNQSRFQKVRLKTIDGHTADSISERTIDNCLFTNGYLHERNKRYSPESKLNCDFYIPEKDLWIEYFGLYGQNEEYDHTVEIKKKIALEKSLNWMFLTPDDLYPENKVIEKVDIFLNKK